jgi:hypothetical protein
MGRRLTALLLALAIALLGPSFGAGGGQPSALQMASAPQCSCPNADQDCGDQGNLACEGALACAVQCGVAVPMLLGNPGRLPAPPRAEAGLIGQAEQLASVTAAPPLRPPTTSIRA